jgi:lipopolysaccharide export LptBFGC system permease protein LptF
MFFYCRKLLHIAIVILIGVIVIFLIGEIVKLIDSVNGYYTAISAYVLTITGILLPNLKYPPSRQKNKK